MTPDLPVPETEWIEAFNTKCREKGTGPSVRAAIGIIEWARENGCRSRSSDLFAVYCHSPAYDAIVKYMKENTGHARAQATARMPESCFFYDDAFWPLVLRRPDRKSDKLVSRLEGMPPALRVLLDADRGAAAQLRVHVTECEYIFKRRFCFDDDAPVVPTEASEFYQGAERSLQSAVSNLVSNPPNEKAAELARDAFESSLKALAVAKLGITAATAKTIGHHLHRLVDTCKPVVSASELKRLSAACDGFPPVAVRYSANLFRGERLWGAYLEGHHALFVTLSGVMGK
jgi:hypothetical protein